MVASHSARAAAAWAAYCRAVARPRSNLPARSAAAARCSRPTASQLSPQPAWPSASDSSEPSQQSQMVSSTRDERRIIGLYPTLAQ
eukprot:scaffold8099_cov81-Isochrysis_galbana.AAC.3